MKVTVDELICVGCRLCEQACVFSRRQHFDPDASYIQVLFNDDGGIQIEIFSGCENCTTPFCMPGFVRWVRLRYVRYKEKFSIQGLC